jgi:hypothetical protein
MRPNLNTIISRHDPENDVIPGMDMRVSWAEANLAEDVLALLDRIEELEQKIEAMQSGSELDESVRIWGSGQK